LAKDADCSSLLAEAHSQGTPQAKDDANKDDANKQGPPKDAPIKDAQRSTKARSIT
jgi:hypothetical protein